MAALAAAPPPRTVVWLDELQRYLDGEHGLTGGVVRALLSAPGPVVLIGTLWPDRYTAYTAVPGPGGPDPHAREREVLDLAAVIRISPEFSTAEQDRARAAAARDPRLREALGAAGYGLTQTLAAAPQLVARWEDAQEAAPYAWAVLTAALDAARLGARAPLTIELLQAAAPGYCTSVQQAEAPANWFEQALAYATTKLHGAAAALVPAGAGMGQIAGYTVADYLLQHASRERRATPRARQHLGRPAQPHPRPRRRRPPRRQRQGPAAIPLRHPAVPACRRRRRRARRRRAGRAAGRARGPGRSCAPGPTPATGTPPGSWPILLAERGDLDELRARADAGDVHAAARLAGLLAGAGTWTSARPRRRRRRKVLAAMRAIGQFDELRPRADGSGGARQLRRPRRNPGHRPSPRTWTSCAPAPTPATRPPPGGWQTCWPSAGTWTSCAPAPTPATGPPSCGWPSLLAERGDLDGLRAQADALVDAADVFAAMRLADLLAERGDLDELRARADAGDEAAAWRLADLLAERGDLDELRARADAGDVHAAKKLADLLAERGDLDEALQILLALTGAGLGNAGQLPRHGNAGQLADLLMQQGRGDEAVRLRRYGLNPDGSIASE